jgi:Tol biopolymer transport system component
VIVYSDLGKLFRVPAEGGEPEPLAALAPGETGRYWPQFLPDGRHYLYLSVASRREDQAIYVGALGSDLRQRVVAAEYAAAYSPPGYLLYIKDDALVAQPFDAARFTLSGTASAILDEEVSRFPGTVLAGRAHFSVSTNGVLAWRPGATTEHRQLTWFDRSGRKLGTLGEPGPYVAHALSPDEKSVAACRVESASNRDIWILEVASGTPRRVTFDPHDDCNPVWSPDGSRIAFFSDRRGVREIYQKRADGSAGDELLVASEDFGLNLESWSADGRFLSYNSAKPGRSSDIFLVPLSKPGEARPAPFLATQAVEHFSALSPNGRFLAYHSDESGREELYVREVAPQGQPGPGKWQISDGVPSLYPRWRPDGRELLFFDRAGLVAASVQTDGSTFRSGVPKPLGVRRGDVPRSFGLWSVSRDGQRLLFGVPTQAPEPIRILVNWLPAGV